MDKFENLQTSSENKQYYIPMEVTAKTIKDFCINPADVVWSRIGNKPKKVIMVPVSEEQYREYMRPLWREDKRQQRQEPMASLDKMYEETEYETADTSDLEADVMKQMMIDELYAALGELEELDRTIIEMYSTNHSEAEIGKAVGMSQRGVGKRKQRILLKLRTRLQDYKYY
jgi:RNA polymerase sigma factor (sigma-70 family)